MRRWIALALMALLLAGCSAPDPQEPAAPKPEESAREEQEPAAEPEPEGPLPPYALLDNENYWREYWLPLAIYGQQPEYRRGESAVNPHNGPYLFVTCWLAQEGRLFDYPRSGDGGILMPLEEFTQYAGLFFGETYADPAVYEEDSTLSERIDREDGTIHLTLSAGVDPVTGRWDSNSGLFLDRRTFQEIEVFVEDGLDKVRIQVTRFEDDTLREIDRHEEYLYYWDGAVGFVVEESSWHWPDTETVRVEGAARRLDSLWGETADEVLRSLDYNYLNALSGDPGLLAAGGRLWRLRLEDDTLVGDSLDLLTLAEETGRELYRFEEEPLLVLPDRDGAFVYTDEAAYRFEKSDGGLDLLRRAPWPEAAKEHSIRAMVVDRGLTRMAYSQVGDLYHLGFEQDARPVLLAAAPANESDFEFDIPSLFPICYLEDGRLFAGVSRWERIGSFQLLSPEGALIRELPFAASGMHSGGVCIYNQSGAVFAPLTGETGYPVYRYEFDSDRLEEAAWLDGEMVYMALNGTGHPGDPHVLYFPRRVYGEEAGETTTYLYRVDFAAQTAERLNFSVTGTEAWLLGADEAGRLLVAYSYKNEQRFCVYDPGPELAP